MSTQSPAEGGSGTAPVEDDDAAAAPSPGHRVDTAGIPAELRDFEWVNWSEGEKGKVPKQTDGRNAKSNDPSTWYTFEDALTAARESENERGMGVGLPITQFEGVEDPEERVVALDIDTPDRGEWVPDLNRLGGAVVERSPSGNLRVYLRGVEKPSWWTNQNAGGKNAPEVKVFDRSGFVTVTGALLDSDGETPELGTTSPVAFSTWLKRAWVAFNDAFNDGKKGDSKPWERDTSTGGGPPPDSTGGGSYSGGKWFDADAAHGALDSIDPDCGYDKWRNVGFALASHFDRATALSLFRDWSRTGEKWDRAAGGLAESIIHDSDDNGGVTVATLVERAKRAGWDPSEHTPSGGQPLSESNGTAADADADADGDTDATTTLTPEAVALRAGLNVEEGETPAKLNDRKKAAYAYELIKESDEYLVSVLPTGEIYHYHNDGIHAGTWTPDGEQRLRVLGRCALGTDYGVNVLAELKEQVRAVSPVPLEEMGLSGGLIPVENGVLDLESRELRDYRPDDYALNRLPVEFDRDADAEAAEWAEFVNDVVPKHWQKAVQEYVGYCLCVGELPIHTALLLVGDGSNGKSTFLDTVQALLGEDNTTSIPLQTLASERDAVADFQGAVANIDADLSKHSLTSKGVGMFKKLVAGDSVRARKLYQDGYSYRPTGKHLYAANEVPDVSEVVEDDDNAFWRRWLIVEFPGYFPIGERDETLRDRLAEPASLSAILNWALDGRDRLLEQGYFSGEQPYPQEKRERWQSWGSSAEDFAANHVEAAPTPPRRTTGDVHERYREWCEEQGRDAVSQQKLTKVLKRQSGLGYKKSLRVGGTTARGFATLGFSDAVPDGDGDRGGSDRAAALDAYGTGTGTGVGGGRP